MHFFVYVQLLVTAIAAVTARVPSVAEDLAALLPQSQVSVEARQRWSDYNLPQPSVIVNVTSEQDVAEIVKYCVSNDVPFLPQNGGNGWAKQFHLGDNGVLINLAALNQTTIDAGKQTATIGGGALIGDTVAAADAAGVLVQTGNCNCLGTLGALLGGGYGNLMGQHGFGVDNVLSLRVVVPSGEILDVSNTSHPDLFWALRGAGPNFGIVTAATVRAFGEDRTAWIMSLTFEPSQIAAVAQAIQDLPLLPQQVVYLVLSNSADGQNSPTVMVTGFLHDADEERGQQAFAPLYALEPLTTSSAVKPYTDWNAANDGFCSRGGRKPAYSTTINAMKADTWPEIWDLYSDFHAKPAAQNSAVLIERYNLTEAQSVSKGSAAMNEGLRTEAFAQAIVIPWYEDVALDMEAEEFAAKVRQIWSAPEDARENPTYINFAHGDETLEAVYGTSLARLRALKKEWDPSGAFGQWFKIE